MPFEFARVETERSIRLRQVVVRVIGKKDQSAGIITFYDDAGLRIWHLTIRMQGIRSSCCSFMVAPRVQRISTGMRRAPLLRPIRMRLNRSGANRIPR